MSEHQPPLAPSPQPSPRRSGERELVQTPRSGMGQRKVYIRPIMLPYLTRECPGVGGVLKERAEDFFVQEIPLYEPSG